MFDDYDDLFTKETVEHLSPEDYQAEYAACTTAAKKWIAPVFDPKTSLKVIPTKQDFLKFSKSRGFTTVHVLRSEYNHHSYIPLTDDFMRAVKRLVDGMKFVRVVELAAGAGWLTFWLRKYGVNISAVDDNSWHMKFESDPGTVQMECAKAFVRRTPETQLYILSWPPYLSTLAEKIWRAMRPGQYLLHIGEGEGGCTGNDKFYELVRDRDVEDEWGLRDSWVQFWGIRDRPVLYLKSVGARVSGHVKKEGVEL